jgi:heme/copper-type cytochrome/quinol oxidase subunit 2
MKGFMEVISDKAFRGWAAEQSATALQKSKATQGAAALAQK